MLVPAVIFLATYAVLAIGSFPGLRIDRTGAALIGATLMLVTGVITFEQAYQAVNYRTLVLLFGMMVVVANLRLSGFFKWVGAYVVAKAHGPHTLLAAVIVTSGILSALFVNDTVCLIFTPLVLSICRQARVSPLPFLIALATSSNIGSTATITGNPQNMLIGTFSHLSYREFTFALAPVAAAGLALDFAVIALVYRKELRWPDHPAEMHERVRVHRPLLIKSLTASLVMIGFFFAGADVPLVALAAAAAILITRRVNPKKVYREIDWELLTLFAGLFVVIAAVEASGLSQSFFDHAGVQQMHRLPYFAGVVAVLSNVVSNVPAVLLFRSFIPHLADPHKGWLVLAMASTLAGNLTILGSIANLIVVQGARREVEISFLEYAKVGVAVTVLSLAVGLILVLR